MWPTQSLGMRLRDLTAVRNHYNLSSEVWDAVVEQMGNPGNDLRLLGALPPSVLATALERATLPDGQPLSALQAAHVGLVYNLTKRILHTISGGDWEAWKPDAVFGEEAQPGEGTAASSSTTTPSMDRKLKMTQVLDQSDDGEFIVEPETTKVQWTQQYLATMGGWPPEEEDVTIEQLSALNRRVKVQAIAPYTDFAVWVPYGQRALRASRFRTYILTDKGYTTKELPGPSCFIQWRACYRVLRTALLMLDQCSIATLHAYEQCIERMARTYPTGWHLVYSADELARSSHSNRLKTKLEMEERAGKTMPTSWNPSKPWDYIFMALTTDEAFWQAQVHGPALVWLAAGSRGTPKTPAEQVAMSYLQGGLAAITPGADHGLHEGSAGKTSSEKPGRNQARREAKKRRFREEKEELQTLRTRHSGTNHQGKGTGKSSQPQRCYGWNNGNGPCADLPPGQACASKTPREHKCTICGSPGHPSRSCPQQQNKKK